ncbi:hybrid sensor histidine kinase/response regulator [Pseudoalteromonas xiamenensis]
MNREHVSQSLNAKHVKILLVEDDEDDFVLTQDRLSDIADFYFDISWHRRLDGAIAALIDESFDLCLLDFRLGHESGLSLLKIAKENHVETPIIMLTGQADSALDEAAMQAGAEDFVVKSELGNARFIRAIRYALARKELKKERVERLKAEAENRAKDQFLAHLSHELRTPLTSILGYTQLLMRQNDQQEIRSELGIIYNNGEHLLKLLDDVLDLSKLQSSTIRLDNKPTNLNALIHNLSDLFQLNAQSKGLQFTIVNRSLEDYWILCDQTRLKQILINLLYNAIKFTFSGEVCLDVTQKDGQLICLVRDTGIGIPEDDLARIFEPFSQVQNVTSKAHEGAGLGLAISANLVELMGGTLKVESKLGEGSCFSFTLPSVVCENTNLDLGHSFDPNLLNWQAKHHTKILVVEDNLDIQQLIKRHVEDWGFSVDVASNGVEVIHKLEQGVSNYAMLLLDLHLPQMDGRQVLASLYSKNLSIPVIAVTAAAQASTLKELSALGCLDVINKPIEPMLLKAAIVKVIERIDELKKSDVLERETIKRVLVVEDDEDSRKLLERLLNAMGLNVQGVGSAKHCKETLSLKSWDLVLMDIGLPDENGLDLATQLRLQYPNMRIAITSGYEPDKAELEKLGIEHVLLKPVSLDMLKSCLS